MRTACSRVAPATRSTSRIFPTTHTLTHTRPNKSSPPNARRLVPQSSDRPPPESTERGTAQRARFGEERGRASAVPRAVPRQYLTSGASNRDNK
eukprot:scaffold66204_cov68-Phaeocystis_antarctica.AAC.2